MVQRKPGWGRSVLLAASEAWFVLLVCLLGRLDDSWSSLHTALEPLSAVLPAAELSLDDSIQTDTTGAFNFPNAVKSHLYSTQDWHTLARTVRYSVHGLASHVNHSSRQLQRFFQNEFRQCPKLWLDKVQLADAAKLLEAGKTVKEVAFELGFKSPSHFCQKFKKYYAVSPLAFVSRRRRVSVVVSKEKSDN